MNSKDLECFVKVYEAQSFSGAAPLLYMTPQGVSKTIKRMEQELQAELFVRSVSGGIHPTEAGAYFYKNILHIISEYHAVEEGVRSISAQSKGILRLVSAFGILRHLTPDFINCFKQENPDIHLDYMEFPDIYIGQNVLAGNYDIGMTPYVDVDPNLNLIPLFSREIYLITGPESAFYEMPEVSIKDIAREPLIIENSNFVIHHIFREACRKHGADCSVYFETSGFSLCYKLVKQGKGNTVSMDFIFDDMGNAELKMIPFAEHLMWNVGLIFRKDIPVSQISGKFIAFAKKWCEDGQ